MNFIKLPPDVNGTIRTINFDHVSHIDISNSDVLFWTDQGTLHYKVTSVKKILNLLNNNTISTAASETRTVDTDREFENEDLTHDDKSSKETTIYLLSSAPRCNTVLGSFRPQVYSTIKQRASVSFLKNLQCGNKFKLTVKEGCNRGLRAGDQYLLYFPSVDLTIFAEVEKSTINEESFDEIFLLRILKFNECLDPEIATRQG